MAARCENLSPKSTVKAVSDPLYGEGDTHITTAQLVSPLVVWDRMLHRREGKALCLCLAAVFCASVRWPVLVR